VASRVSVAGAEFGAAQGAELVVTLEYYVCMLEVDNCSGIVTSLGFSATEVSIDTVTRLHMALFTLLV
jgi:hypothetical protein